MYKFNEGAFTKIIYMRGLILLNGSLIYSLHRSYTVYIGFIVSLVHAIHSSNRQYTVRLNRAHTVLTGQTELPSSRSKVLVRPFCLRARLLLGHTPLSMHSSSNDVYVTK